MRAKVEAVFLGIEENSFTDSKTGDVIPYRRATFNVRNTPETFTLSVPKDVDTSLLQQYNDAFVIVDFRFNTSNSSFKGRLINVMPDSKTLASAPLLSQEESRNL